MDSQKRLLVALGLSFALTLIYLSVIRPPTPPPTALAPDAGVPAAAQAPDAGAPAIAAAPELADAGVPVAAELPPIQTVAKERPQIHYTFSTGGAGLVEAELQGPKMRETQTVGLVEGLQRLFGKDAPPPPQMDMAKPVEGRPLPLAVSIAGPQPLPADARYRVVENTPERLVLSARAGIWEVTKTFEWKDEFELGYTVQLRNLSGAPATGQLAVHYSREVDPANEHAGSIFGGIANLSQTSCLVGEDFHNVVPKPDEPPPSFEGPIRFFGINQQYFLAAVFPIDGQNQGRCTLSSSPTMRVVEAAFPVTVNAGETLTRRYGVFIGPKDIDLLAQVGPRAVAGIAGVAPPPLEKTVEFGIWAVICKALIFLLKLFYGVVHNWGVAIILLTVLAKVVLLPLTHKSMVSAEALKKLQPRVEEIRKKYAADKEMQTRETMKLYQEAKVNPFGGCLPMLVQLPIWISLFTTLRTSYELYREPFISPFWMDLTSKDPSYILPLILGVTMIVTQKLQPQMMDPTQAKIMTYVMPVFFTALMMNYPAGLSLYILTSNILTVAQQYGLRKYLEKKGHAAPPPAQPEKKKLKESKA